MKNQNILGENSKLGGKPHIAGTRMSVHQISLLHKSDQWTIDRIADEFDLTHSQIYAALAYYYDHQTAIDAEILADDNATKQIGKPLSDVQKSDGSSSLS